MKRKVWLFEGGACTGYTLRKLRIISPGEAEAFFPGHGGWRLLTWIHTGRGGMWSIWAEPGKRFYVRRYPADSL